MQKRLRNASEIVQTHVDLLQLCHPMYVYPLNIVSIEEIELK